MTCHDPCLLTCHDSCLLQRGDQGKSGHLSDLVYLDYKLVDPEKVQLAKEQWQDELYEEQEKEVRRAEDAQKLVAAQLKLRQLQEANLEGVDTLLRDMLHNDPEQLRSLHHHPPHCHKHHTQTHAPAHTNTQANTHKQPNIHIHMQMHMRIHVYAYMCIHAGISMR